MNISIDKINNRRYELIMLGGLVTLIMASLSGWSSRTLWVLAIIEVIVLCLFLLVSTGIIKREAKLLLSLKIFLFFSFLSAVFSVYFYNSLISFVELLLFITAFWLVVQFVKTEQQLKFFSIALSIAALAAAVGGIINFFQLQNITLGVASFFGWRNIFAGFILLVLPVVLTSYLTANKKTEKYFYGITSILLGANLYFTFSQAGWLAFLLALSVIIWFLRNSPKKKLLARLAAWGAATLLLSIFMLQLHSAFKPAANGAEIGAASSIQVFSIENRLDYWKTSLAIFTHYPWLGVGGGNFKTLYTHFQQNIWSFSISPHNFLLLLLTETGILGAAAFLFFLFQLYRAGLKTAQRSKQFKDRAVFSFNLGLLGALTAFLAHNLADLDWEVPSLLLLFFIEAGLLLAVNKISQFPSLKPERLYLPEKKSKFVQTPAFGFLMFLILGYLIIIPALTDLWNKQADKIQENLTQSGASIPILIKANKLNPLNAELYRNLSESYQLKILDHKGDRRENQYLSVKYAKKAANLDPKNSERRQFLGYALNFVSSGKDNEIQEAEKELKTAIEYNPKNNPYYYQLLGFVLIRQGKYQEALDVLDIPLKLFDEESVKKIFADQKRYELINNYLARVKKLRGVAKKYMEENK